MRQPVNIPDCDNEKVPQPQHPFYHCIDIQTRFNDFDLLGHLNNSVYLSYMDLAKVHYFEAVMHKKLTPADISVVVVNINVSFFSPTYPTEEVSVTTACVKISQHSFVLEQRVVNPKNGDVKCAATVVMAGFDPSTATGCEISAEWATALSNYESGM